MGDHDEAEEGNEADQDAVLELRGHRVTFSGGRTTLAEVPR